MIRMLMKPKITVNPTCFLNKPYEASSNKYSVEAIYKYKNNAKIYAPDDNKNHPIRAEITCADTDCKNKQCEYPCDDTELIFHTKGHYTHKPPQNKSSVIVSNTDIDGKNKDQYYVENKDSTKDIPSKSAKEMTEEDLVPQQKATAFTKQTDIAEILKKLK